MVCTSIQIYTYGSQISRSQQLELKINTGLLSITYDATVSYLFLCMKHRSEWCILHRNSAKGKSPAVVIATPGRDIPYLLSLTAGVWLPPPIMKFSILAASWKEFDYDLLNDTHIDNWGKERKLQGMLTCTSTCRDLYLLHARPLSQTHAYILNVCTVCDCMYCTLTQSVYCMRLCSQMYSPLAMAASEVARFLRSLLFSLRKRTIACEGGGVRQPAGDGVITLTLRETGRTHSPDLPFSNLCYTVREKRTISSTYFRRY